MGENRFAQFKPEPAKRNRFAQFSAQPQERYNIDFNLPVEEVRAKIALLPKQDRQGALKSWADVVVDQENKEGGVFHSIDNGVRALARGTLFGSFADEATAFTSSAPYDETLAYQRARDRRFDQDNPATSLALRLGGGLAGGLGVAKQVVKYAPKAIPKTTLGQSAAGATYGAVSGYVAGFGEGEGGAANRHESGKNVAALGAVLGGVAPVAIRAVTDVARPLVKQLSPGVTARRQGPAAAADQIIGRTIDRSGRNVQSHIDDLQQGQHDARFRSNSEAELPEALADQSDSLQRLSGSVYRAGGAAGDYTRELLEARQRGPLNPFARDAARPPRTEHLDGQVSDVIDSYDRALQVKSSGSARVVERELVEEQRKTGQELYDKAYKNSQPFNIQDTLTRFALRTQQYPDGSKMSGKMYRSLNLFVPRTANNMSVTNIQRFDAAKKALDDSIDKSIRAGEGNLARELTQFKHELLQSVHAGGRNEAYRVAREAWGSTAERRNAIEAGRNAFKEDAEVSVEAFKAMSSGEQQLFRIGLRDALRHALSRKRSGHDVTLSLQERRIQELMAEVIPRSAGKKAVYRDRPERFGNLINRQNRMTQTRQRTLGGSQTAERISDDLQFGAQAAASLIDRFRETPSIRGLFLEFGGEAFQKLFGFRQDVALQIARRLLEMRPDRRLAYLRRLQTQVPPDRYQAFIDDLQWLSQVAGETVAREAGGPQ